jgi:hypothetical protein
LFDRFALISGPIYGSVNFMAPPNDCFQDRVWHMTMEAAFLALRPVMIYCLPPLDVVKANLKNDDASARVVGNNIETIYYQYQARAARDFAIGIAGVYDYTMGGDFRTVLGRIHLRVNEGQR